MGTYIIKEGIWKIGLLITENIKFKLILRIFGHPFKRKSISPIIHQCKDSIFLTFMLLKKISSQEIKLLHFS